MEIEGFYTLKKSYIKLQLYEICEENLHASIFQVKFVILHVKKYKIRLSHCFQIATKLNIMKLFIACFQKRTSRVTFLDFGIDILPFSKFFKFLSGNLVNGITHLHTYCQYHNLNKYNDISNSSL